NGELQVLGTASNSAYTNLSSWRLETKIHDLPSTWSGYIQVWSVGNFEVKLLAIDANNRYLYFGDAADNFSTSANIGNETNIMLRVQKTPAGIRSLSVWNSAGTSIPTGPADAGHAGDDDLRGTVGSPQHI